MTYLPLSYLFGSRAKVDIIRILVNKQNYTGRKIAALSSTNPNSNKKALDFLIETGLVCREQVGNSFRYNLNSKHFLYESIITLFKEEDKIINKIMKCSAAFIEEFAPKTLAGFLSYRQSNIELVVIDNFFPVNEMVKYIYEQIGFKVLVKVVDTFSLNEKSVPDYAEKIYFWNNYKSILKMLDSRNIVKNFFSF